MKVIAEPCLEPGCQCGLASEKLPNPLEPLGITLEDVGVDPAEFWAELERSIVALTPAFVTLGQAAREAVCAFEGPMELWRRLGLPEAGFLYPPSVLHNGRKPTARRRRRRR